MASPKKGETDTYFQNLLDEEVKKDDPDWKVVRQFIKYNVHMSPPERETGITMLHKAAYAGIDDVIRWCVGLPDINLNAKNVRFH